MRAAPRRAILGMLRAVLGRRVLVRAGRMLLDGGLLDGSNAIDSNGEQLVQRVVAEHVCPEGDLVVFDVGANVGEWTQSMLAVWADQGGKDIEIHAFEPSRFTFARLREHLDSDPHGQYVVTVNHALSDEPGSARLYVSHEGAGSNSLHRRFHGRDSRHYETVQVGTLDSYCRERNLAQVHLLKCDAEGHDLAVLRGARSLLEAGCIDVVQFEYNCRWIDNRSFLRDAFEFLEPLGYRLGKVTPAGIEFYETWDYELETFREGNYLACREDWVGRFPRVARWTEARR